MRTEKRSNGTAAEKYAEFIGKHVIIYYRDMRDTDRRLHGVVIDARGDGLYLQNGEWNVMLDCKNARVILVSTVAGWSRDIESKEERGIFRNIFKR